MQRLTFVAVLACLFASPAALAQTAFRTPFGPKAEQEQPCLKEVSRFEQTIALIRQTQGVEAAAHLKEMLLPAALEHQIIFDKGYCGLADYLREHRLIDKPTTLP